jgi:hypothetical protein
MMKKSRFQILFAAAVLGLSTPLHAQNLELVTPGFALKFRGDRAWTISEIEYKGAVISGPTGFHGLVLAIGPALFIGSGHKEGGEEVVESIEVKLDGAVLDPPEGSLDCREAVITKRSQLGDWTHEAVIRLTAEKLELDYRIKATKDTYIELMYPFMFCWSPLSTEWMAQTRNGEILEGEFRSDNGWQLEKDVDWSAIYIPDKQMAAVLRFDENLPDGALHKHGFWDREAYHKQYYQSFWRANIEAGQDFHYRVALQVAEGGVNNWKQLVQELLEKK